MHLLFVGESDSFGERAQLELVVVLGRDQHDGGEHHARVDRQTGYRLMWQLKRRKAVVGRLCVKSATLLRGAISNAHPAVRARQ